MVREYTVLSALHPTGVPVPKTLGLCVDKDVSDVPFYVMECVNGVILRDSAQAKAAFDIATRAAIGEHLAATLAKLHQVDVDDAGLGGLARHDGYIERQVRRWREQFAQTLVDGAEFGGLAQAVADQLFVSIPIQQRVSVVHGDYRLDNTVLDSRGRVLAILDWEICTLGIRWPI
jgi:aminoglycoside phosphotransferase (APT) family kinase protein